MTAQSWVCLLKLLNDMLKEYKVALVFVAKFLAFYVIANVGYGLFIEAFDKVDPITLFVTKQASIPINWIYDEISISLNDAAPTAFLNLSGNTVISVFEGCNGVNVGIIFLSFVFAYKGRLRITILFSLLGLLVIYISNIFRVFALFWVAESRPEYLYYMHKYVFTGFIYFVVFLMWIWWVKKTRVSI